MSQAANAVHRYDVAAARSRITERVVNGHACAHERPGFLGWQFIRNRGQRCRRRDHVFSVTTVEIDSGDFAIDAHGEIAALALGADKTMSAMPPHPDSLTFLPF